MDERCKKCIRKKKRKRKKWKIKYGGRRMFKKKIVGKQKEDFQNYKKQIVETIKRISSMFKGRNKSGREKRNALIMAG